MEEEALSMSERGLYDRIVWEKQSEKIPFPEEGRIMSEECIDYCFAELRDKAKYFQQTNLVPALDSAGNAVVKSDSLISKDLHEELGEIFKTLAADQRGNEDWHPGSNEMQLNLVHPSMYPLVWGRSAYFQDEIVGVQDAIAGQSTPQTTPKHAEVEKPNLTMRRMGYNIGSGTIPFELWSSKYQWLPSTVSFDGIGKPKFTSYINNLNPQKYSKMYNVLENLVDVVIPAWDQCLQEREIRRRGGEKATCSQAGRQGTRFDAVRDASDSNEDLWVPFDLEHWRNLDAKLTNEQLHELNEDCFREKEGDGAELSMEELEEFDRCEDEGEPVPTPHITEEALAREKWRQYRTPIYPEPGKYEPVDYTPTKSIRDMFKEHGLQIIVKMASIELTPEKPDFPGGSWHIEGQMNERICATALYYVDCENVTASKLAFRMSTDSYLGDDIKVGQDEYGWLEKVHGVSLEHSGGLPDACLQTYGDVETRQRRVLAFPNVFQHRVSPFSLEDKSKPGHRRFIALWLIDPHQRILSTANVPPQQRDWWEDAMKDHGARLLPSSFPKNLISVEEAKEHRQKLMEERSYIGKSHEVEWTRPEYNFCEH